MQDFPGGGSPIIKCFGFWIYMPRSNMLRAAKLRVVARGVWGYAPPPKKIFENGAFSCVFEGYFQPLS